MKVMKFGGTSVGTPNRMHEVKNLVTQQDDDKIVVLSAVSGTTNALVTIGDLINKNKFEAEKSIKELHDKYIAFSNELIHDPKYTTQAKEVVEKHFSLISSFLEQDFTDHTSRELLAQGELLSTQLFSIYLEQENIKSKLIPALSFMSTDQNEEPEIEKIKHKLGKIITENSDHNLFITQGYICLNKNNEIDNLKRGGSDYTASLIGVATGAEEIQIWTDIDGMHNNDPRYVEDTFPIAEMSFDEAAELAYFGAKILHPSSILPAQKYNVPVRLKNTMDPNASGTVISSKQKSKIGVTAIAAKDDITAIKIKSSRMLLAHGFLTKVFQVFEKYKTPIDMITTSEVAVSLTIDNSQYVREIEDELKVFGTVIIDHNQTIVCIAGNMVSEEKSIVKRIFDALDDIPLRMISFGGSKHNISVLIDSANKKEALNSLNKGVFDIVEA